MNSEERSPLQRIGGRVLAVALVPGIVGVATANWLSSPTTPVHLGLWTTCHHDWYSVVRGLCTMSLCLHVMSVISGCCCSIMGNFQRTSVSFLPRLEEASAIIAGIFMAGGLGVFARSRQSHPLFQTLQLDWSFWLCLAHLCLLLLCGGVIALTRHDYACHRWCTHRRGHQRVIMKRTLRNLEVTSCSGHHSKHTVETEGAGISTKHVGVGRPSSSLRESEEASESSRWQKWTRSDCSPVYFFSSLDGMPRAVEKLASREILIQRA